MWWGRWHKATGRAVDLHWLNDWDSLRYQENSIALCKLLHLHAASSSSHLLGKQSKIVQRDNLWQFTLLSSQPLPPLSLQLLLPRTISKLLCNIGGNSSGSGMNLEPRCNLSFTHSTNTQPSVGGSLLAMPQPYKRNHVCNIKLSITHNNIAKMDFVQVDNKK